MKRGLIIIANYHPNPSSVANCMKPLIERLSKDYIIDIITDKGKVDVLNHEIKDKMNIYRIDDFRKMNTQYLNDLMKINSSFALKLFSKILSNTLKIFYYIRYVAFAKEKDSGGWEVSRVFNKFKELDSEHEYDFIISVSLPFQSHYIGEKIKEMKGNSIKWVVFEFDPFAYNKVIKVNNRMRKNMRVDEKRIFSKCDSIILTPELFEFYKREEYIPSSTKINKLPFANVEPINYNSENVSQNFLQDDKINCFFSGRLYKDIRNPSIAFDLFSKISTNIHLTLMTNYTTEKIKEFAPQNYLPSVISFQNRDTALHNLLYADILVNIGNTVEHQVPGKIFEYMSTGKPIVHFSKIKNDPAIKYLDKYSNVLIIKEWDIGNINYVKILDDFCNENKCNELTFEEVHHRLGEYSGRSVQDKFSSIINNMLGEK